eukprot:357381-Chlamydomonas_euryale.AAC.15
MDLHLIHEECVVSEASTYPPHTHIHRAVQSMVDHMLSELTARERKRADEAAARLLAAEAARATGTAAAAQTQAHARVAAAPGEAWAPMPMRRW